MNPYFLSNLLLWIVVVIQSILIILLLNNTTKFLSRLRLISGMQIESKLSIGDIAPISNGINYKNEKVNLRKLAPENVNILLFVKENCSICSDVMSEIFPLLNQLEEKYQLHIIQIGKFDEKKIDLLDSYNSNNNIHYIRNDNLISDFEITRAPTIIIYDKDKIINSINIINDVRQLKEVLLSKRPFKKVVS